MMIKINDKVQLKGSAYRMTVLRYSFEADRYGHLVCGWIGRRTEQWNTATFAPELLEVVEKAPAPATPPVKVGDVIILPAMKHIKMVVAEVLDHEAVCYWHDDYGDFNSANFDYDAISFA